MANRININEELSSMLLLERRKLKECLNSRDSLLRMELSILLQVNHPQTNGKIERFYGTLDAKARHFDTIDEFIEWYNCKAAYGL